MKKKLKAASIASILIACSSSSTVSAALLNTSILKFESGFSTLPPDSSSVTYINAGSYFSMDSNDDGIITPLENIAIKMNDGLSLGNTQSASGSHLGLPDCIPDQISCNDTTPSSEAPGIDTPWSFLGSTGMSLTVSPTNVLSATENTATVDFSGWAMTWGGLATNIGLGSGAWLGNPDGVATVVCGVDCGDGDTFTLEYSATILPGDPSSLGGVKYALHLEGAVSAVPVPPALWLFASGLLSLFSFRLRKK